MSILKRIALYSIGSLIFTLLALQASPAMAQANVIWQPSTMDYQILDATGTRYVTQIGCPQVTWHPDFSSMSAYRNSRAPLQNELQARLGSLPPNLAGELQNERVLVENSAYKISWVRLASRLHGVSVYGYLARPLGSIQPHPAVVVLHGDGMPPHTIFGWRLPGDESYTNNPAQSALSNIGVDLVTAGYTVFVPWLNDDRSLWRPWYEVERWSTLLASKQGSGSAHSFFVPQVMAVIDFLHYDSTIQPDKVALIGWSQGAQVAAVTAAVDDRVNALVLLEPTINKRSWRLESGYGQNDGAAFEQMDCTFGQIEMAALVAPRPLLFSSTPADSVFQHYGLVNGGSTPVYTSISTLYTGLGASANISQSISTDVHAAGALVPMQWLNQHFSFSPRSMPPLAPPTAPSDWVYPVTDHNAYRNQVAQYLANLGACKQISANIDYSSVPNFLSSTEQLRTQILARLTGQELLPQKPVIVVERRLILSNTDYKLEWVRFRGRFSGVEDYLGGYLATPLNGPTRKPTVLSTMGYENLNWSFGIQNPSFPYLNAYGDYLARHGYIVFVPYIQYGFDIWGAILRARTNHAVNNWDFLLPFYLSSVDFLLAEPDVDPHRIAAYGLSYGGYAALYTAAFDPRISTLLYSNPAEDHEYGSTWTIAYLVPVWLTDLCATANQVLPLLIAPRRLIWENGHLDFNAKQLYPTEVKDRIASVYEKIGYSQRFDYIGHEKGHETRPWLFTIFYPPPIFNHAQALPTSDPNRHLLRLIGENFLPSPTITLGNIPISVTDVTSTTIDVMVPIALPDGNYPLVIENYDGYQATATLKMDTVAPTGALALHPSDSPLPALPNGELVRNPQISLMLTAIDNMTGVTQMRLGEEGTLAASRWEAYTPLVTWQLSPGDGWKTIHAQYQDGAGNLSPIYSHTLLLDTTPPTGTLAINGNALESTSGHVTLSFQTSDENGSSIAGVSLSNDGIQFSSLLSTTQPLAWDLAEGLGKRTVYARFVDAAGNQSTTTLHTIQVVDPGTSPSIAVNSNALFVNTQTVTLTIMAPGGISDMAIRDSVVITQPDQAKAAMDETGWQWLPYQRTLLWTLADYGNNFPHRIIYVRFRDVMGNLSPTYFYDFILDEISPTGEMIINDQATYAITTSVKLAFHADDLLSGVSELRVSHNISFTDGVWLPYTAEMTWQLHENEDQQTLYVQYRDRAGNLSKTGIATIMLLTSTSARQVVTQTWQGNGMLLKFDVTNALRDVISMQIGLEPLDMDAPWQPLVDSYMLPLDNAKQTIYLRFRDKTQAVSSLLQLDPSIQLFLPFINR